MSLTLGELDTFLERVDSWQRKAAAYNAGVTTSHPSGTSDDNTKPMSEGARLSEYKSDLPQATHDYGVNPDKGQLGGTQAQAQPNMGVNQKEVSQAEHIPEKNKEDTPTSTPASTEKITKEGGFDALKKQAIDRSNSLLAKLNLSSFKVANTTTPSASAPIVGNASTPPAVSQQVPTIKSPESPSDAAKLAADAGTAAADAAIAKQAFDQYVATKLAQVIHLGNLHAEITHTGICEVEKAAAEAAKQKVEDEGGEGKNKPKDDKDKPPEDKPPEDKPPEHKEPDGDEGGGGPPMPPTTEAGAADGGVPTNAMAAPPAGGGGMEHLDPQTLALLLSLIGGGHPGAGGMPPGAGGGGMPPGAPGAGGGEQIDPAMIQALLAQQGSNPAEMKMAILKDAQDRLAAMMNQIKSGAAPAAPAKNTSSGDFKQKVADYLKETIARSRR